LDKELSGSIRDGTAVAVEQVGIRKRSSWGSGVDDIGTEVEPKPAFQRPKGRLEEKLSSDCCGIEGIFLIFHSA